MQVTVRYIEVERECARNVLREIKKELFIYIVSLIDSLKLILAHNSCQYNAHYHIFMVRFIF